MAQRSGLGIDLGYESYDDDSGDELVDLGARGGKGGIRSRPVYENYAAKRQKLRNAFKADNFVKKKKGRDKAVAAGTTKLDSRILAQIVVDFETGNPGANTHVMMDDDTGTTLYQANTATGVKLAVGKLKRGKNRVRVKQAAARSLKVKNLHTEMFILHKATGGAVKNVKNALNGKNVVVDKPCCKMCYYWMKKAGAIVTDGTSFATVTGKDRQAFDWANPFTKEFISAANMANMSDSALASYVNQQVD
ncbi:MAG TPA: hypothetical protein VGN75_05375 [Kaistia sp.]|nr:hypothetical protein [Kaistia sp.]